MPRHAASLDQSSEQLMGPDPLGRLQPRGRASETSRSLTAALCRRPPCWARAGGLQPAPRLESG
jgi:hypothetical protein